MNSILDFFNRESSEMQKSVECSFACSLNDLKLCEVGKWVIWLPLQRRRTLQPFKGCLITFSPTTSSTSIFIRSNVLWDLWQSWSFSNINSWIIELLNHHFSHFTFFSHLCYFRCLSQKCFCLARGFEFYQIVICITFVYWKLLNELGFTIEILIYTK